MNSKYVQQTAHMLMDPTWNTGASTTVSIHKSQPFAQVTARSPARNFQRKRGGGIKTRGDLALEGAARLVSLFFQIAALFFETVSQIPGT